MLGATAIKVGGEIQPQESVTLNSLHAKKEKCQMAAVGAARLSIRATPATRDSSSIRSRKNVKQWKKNAVPQASGYTKGCVKRSVPCGRTTPKMGLAKSATQRAENARALERTSVQTADCQSICQKRHRTASFAATQVFSERWEVLKTGAKTILARISIASTAHLLQLVPNAEAHLFS